jgi:guanosine-3',5'-bis(diphosphate) 3'-pyrophosphohydrolase
MKLLIAAIAFAADKHRNQRRKDAEASPYINHPIALANLLANEAGIDDQRVLLAAIFHDTIEDTETTEQELIRHFGKDVADIVLELTDDKSLPKSERKRLQIVHAAHISRRAPAVGAGYSFSSSGLPNCALPWLVLRRRKLALADSVSGPW